MARSSTVVAVLIAVVSALIGVPHFLEELTVLLKKANRVWDDQEKGEYFEPTDDQGRPKWKGPNHPENIKISLTDLQNAERILQDKFLDNWRESMDIDTTVIRTADLKHYVEVVGRKWELSEVTCEELNLMAYATFKDKRIFDITAESEFESKLGYISMTRNLDTDSITISYAVHQLHFGLFQVEQVEKREDTYFLGFIPTGTNTEISHELKRAKISIKDMALIRDTYMRSKALEAMRDLGAISKINYVK